jgi:hypothetical protein
MDKKNSPKSATTTDPKALVVQVANPESAKERHEAMAQVATSPEFQSTLTTRTYCPLPADEININSLSAALEKRGADGARGDLSQGERMLVAQAHALDAIFGECARRARANMGEYTQTAELYLRVGLRAQSQCRATWETLAAIKNPAPVAFVRQANFAAGPQQVNNGVPAPSRAGEDEKTPNKLLEADDGTRMDTRAASAASRANPELEAVGESYGADHGGR